MTRARFLRWRGLAGTKKVVEAGWACSAHVDALPSYASSIERPGVQQSLTTGIPTPTSTVDQQGSASRSPWMCHCRYAGDATLIRHCGWKRGGEQLLARYLAPGPDTSAPWAAPRTPQRHGSCGAACWEGQPGSGAAVGGPHLACSEFFVPVWR